MDTLAIQPDTLAHASRHRRRRRDLSDAIALGVFKGVVLLFLLVVVPSAVLMAIVNGIYHMLSR